MGLLREASEVADTCETWRLLWSPVAAICEDPTLPAVDVVSQVRHSAGRCRRWCEETAATTPMVHDDLNELAVSCRFTELFADKVTMARESGDSTRSVAERRQDGVSGIARPTDPSAGADKSRRRRDQWRESLTHAANAYAECWHARNKPSGLNDILLALKAASHDLRSAIP